MKADEPARGTRPLWDDRWLIAAFRRLGHAAVERLTDTAQTAWEALEEAGVSADQLLETVCAMSHTAPAKLDAVDVQHTPLLDRMLAALQDVDTVTDAQALGLLPAARIETVGESCARSA